MIIQQSDIPWLHSEVQSIVAMQSGMTVSMQAVTDQKIQEVLIKIDEINDKLLQLEDYIDDQLADRFDKQ